MSLVLKVIVVPLVLALPHYVFVFFSFHFPGIYIDVPVNLPPGGCTLPQQQLTDISLGILANFRDLLEVVRSDDLGLVENLQVMVSLCSSLPRSSHQQNFSTSVTLPSCVDPSLPAAIITLELSENIYGISFHSPFFFDSLMFCFAPPFRPAPPPPPYPLAPLRSYFKLRIATYYPRPRWISYSLFSQRSIVSQGSFHSSSYAPSLTSASSTEQEL